MSKEILENKLALISFLILLVLIAVRCFGSLGVNITGSLPQRLFWVTNIKKLQLDDFVALYARDKLLIKLVGGLEGDVVHFKQGQVFVNEKLIGKPSVKSSKGEPLTPIKPSIIPKGRVFVYAPHAHSFDSRYQEMGLIALSQIKGRAHAIF